MVPDVVVLHNADLYTCAWRRTLAQLLQLGVPVVLTVYCEHEGTAMERLFQSSGAEFKEDVVTRCDDLAIQLYGGDDAAVQDTESLGAVPEPHTLWPVQPNPHASEPPKDCLGDEQHGVRNGYWMAFTGARSPGQESHHEDEL